MEKSGKVWGQTFEVFCKNNVEIHRIEIKNGGYCSKHKHASKFNAFYVESGSMEIHKYKNEYALVDVTLLGKGDYTVCPPNEYHLFKAVEDTIAFEIYWVEISKEDIVRENHGGMKDVQRITKKT